MFVFGRQAGGIVGVSIGSTIFSNIFASGVKKLPPLSLWLAPCKSASAAIDFIPMSRTLVVDPVFKREVLKIQAERRKWIWIGMAVVSGFVLLTGLLVEGLTLKKECGDKG